MKKRTPLENDEMGEKLLNVTEQDEERIVRRIIGVVQKAMAGHLADFHKAERTGYSEEYVGLLRDEIHKRKAAEKEIVDLESEMEAAVTNIQALHEKVRRLRNGELPKV